MLKFAAVLLATSAVVLTAPVLSTSAQAGLVTQTGSYGYASTDWSGSSHHIGIAQFDASLGRLTSVSVSVTETVNGNVTIVGTYPITANNLVGDAAIAVIDPFQNFSSTGCDLTFAICSGGVTFGTLTGADVKVVNVTTPVSYTGPQVFNVDHLTGSSGDTYSASFGDVVFTTSDSHYLNGFTGTGTVDMVLVTQTNLSGDISGGNPFITQSTQDLATVTVEYTYDTPEPASLTLFGGALAALGAIRRRKATR